MELMTTLQGLLPDSVMTWLTFAVTLCAALAVALRAPDEKSGAVYRAVYAVINWIGLNLGKARNAEQARNGAQSSQKS